MFKNRQISSLFIAVLCGANVYAQSNDICTNAERITASTDSTCVSNPGIFSGVREEAPASPCRNLQSPSAYDQWFVFSAEIENQAVEVETPDMGGFMGTGAVVEVYDACGGNQIGCANPEVTEVFGFIIVQAGITRVNLQGLTPSQDYFVRVFPYGDTLPEPGADLFEICVKGASAAPDNDVCDNAIALLATDTCSPILGSVEGAGENADLERCGQESSPSAFDVWFSFQPKNSKQVVRVAPVGAETDLAPVIEIWDSCGGSVLDCSNPQVFPFIGAVSETNTITVSNLDTNLEYLVRVYHFGDREPEDGSFEICVFDAPPPPANDSCANAITLNLADSCVQTEATLISANQESDPNTCDTTSATAFDVFFTFEAADRDVLIEVNSESVAAVIEVLDACDGNLIDCAEPFIIPDFGAFPGQTLLETSLLDSGTTYTIRVYHFGEEIPSEADFTICVYNAPLPPENDECENAIEVTVANSRADCQPTAATTIGATASQNVSNCDDFGVDDDVWFAFNATDSRIVAAAFNKTDDLVFTNMAFALWSSDCQTEIACVEDTDVDTMFFTGLTAGQDYLLRVYSIDENFSGDFDLCLYASPSLLPNDECSGAISLTASADDNCVSETFSFADATQEADPEFCEEFESETAFDQWFQFTALTPEHSVEVTTPPTGGFQGVGAVVEVYDACGGELIGCGEPNIISQGGFVVVQSGTTTASLTNLIVGSNYFIRVYNFGDTLPEPGTDDISICVKGAPDPVINDICDDALVLEVNENCVFTTGTVAGATEEAETVACAQTPASPTANDVWYRFTAANSVQIVDVIPDETGFQGLPLVVEIYDGCTARTPVFCSGPLVVQGFAISEEISITADNLSVGADYFVRIYEYVNNSNDKNFSVCVYNDPAIGILETQASVAKIYPNPSKEKFYVALKNANGNGNLMLHDNSGRLLLERDFNNDPLIEIEVPSKASGIYTLTVLSNGQIEHFAVAIE